jgi:hypothetical protein
MKVLIIPGAMVGFVACAAVLACWWGCVWLNRILNRFETAAVIRVSTRGDSRSTDKS